MPISGWRTISAAEIGFALRERVTLGHDAEQLPGGQRLENHARMVEPVADRHDLALAKQQVVDRLLDLEDVDIDHQVRMGAPDPLDRPRRHDVRDARHGADPQFLCRAGLETGDHRAEILDVAEHRVDLLEDPAGPGGRDEPSVPAVEQPESQGRLGVFHQPAEPGRRDVEELGRTREGPGHHDGADHLDLAQGQHRIASRRPAGETPVIERPGWSHRTAPQRPDLAWRMDEGQPVPSPHGFVS